MRKTLDVLAAVILLGLGALLLTAYPVAILVGGMSFDAGSAGFLHEAIFLGIYAYPGVYLPAAIFSAMVIYDGNHRRARVIASAPLLYLLFLFGCALIAGYSLNPRG